MANDPTPGPGRPVGVPFWPFLLIGTVALVVIAWLARFPWGW